MEPAECEKIVSTLLQESLIHAIKKSFLAVPSKLTYSKVSYLLQFSEEEHAMKANRLRRRITAAALAAVLAVTGIPGPVQTAKAAEENTVRVNVHDPSVISADGTYYIFGSHMADAKSTDLIHWTQTHRDYDNIKTNSIYGDVVANFAESFLWAGYQDGFSKSVQIWAPDVIWNPNYRNEDGSTGAYMLYYSTTSSWCRSCIGYAVSKNAEGPYEYSDTIMYSGFTKTGTPGENSTRNTKWDNDYLNLMELTDLGSENGGIDDVSDNWFTSSGEWNHLYAPNAIDPTVFFDEDGGLNMVYGSWSGGIYLLALDPATGEPIYPGTDSTDSASGNYVDRYFGTHIAGGNHQSGEGAYVLYDEESDYYYLYETYGELGAYGGYNMRLFRSKNAAGPYLDASGKNAADSKNNNEGYGIKLIGNYRFSNQDGYRSAGHNSAFIDSDGQRYLIYHQRFDKEMTAGYDHEVRVHQQFLNAEGWPVTAVYEYQGDTIAPCSDADIVGNYELINHGTETSSDMRPTIYITLNEDGSISGDAAGSWTRTAGTDYDYATITMDDVTYQGVYFLQTPEDTDSEPVMTFSAIGTDNACIWARKVENRDSLTACEAADLLDNKIPEIIRDSVSLPAVSGDATVTWESSRKDILSPDGTLMQPDEDTKIILTATVSYQTGTVTREFPITVYGKPQLMYGYDFNQAASDGTITPIEGSARTKLASLEGSAAISEDDVRGSVLSITGNEGDTDKNYLAIPADAFSKITDSGFTIGMWVNIGESTWEHSALFEANAGGANAYPMTRIGANLIARINANNAFSDVQEDLLWNGGSRDVWQHVVYTVDASGIRVYLDGELAGEETKDLSACFADSDTSIRKVTRAAIGSGIIWNDEDVRDARFDDVRIYSGAMTAAQAKALMEETLPKEDEDPGDTPNPPDTDDDDKPGSGDEDNNKPGSGDEDNNKPDTGGSKPDNDPSQSNPPQNSGNQTPASSGKIVLTGTTSYKKVYGDKAFSLDVAFAEGSGTLTYQSSNTKVASVNASGTVKITGTGKAAITVTATSSDNSATSSLQISITAAPKKTSVSSIKTAGKKSLKLTWKKSAKASGYVVEYAANKKFKGGRKKTVKSKTTVTLKGLKSGKKYYVRIRPYVKTSSGNVYGAYSSVKKKTVK